nr:L-type lectin-domain containing receptor kinase IX.1-like [Tanacetum cinerariifolium]
ELASFTTNFTFVIDSNRATFYADGLTFFLAQNNSEIYVGGSMGLPINGTAGVNTTTQFVAVEFDTFWNRGWDPLNSSNNPMGDHVGISISSLRSVRTQKWLSNVTGGGVCQAWITYDSASSNLSVSFTGFQNNAVIRQDGLEYTIDLRLVLPEWVIFGFSAATGSLFEKNNVRSWSFDSSELEVDKNNEPPLLPPIPNPDLVNGNNSKGNKSKIGLIVGLPVVITFLGVLVLVLVLWRRKKKTREVEAEETGFDIEMDNEFEMGTGPKRFTYHELAQATGDFAENEKLGEGGFGGVYKGFLKDSNTFVAVKRVSKSSKQGIKEKQIVGGPRLPVINFATYLAHMEFSRTHLISHLLLVMISSAAPVTFNLTNIGPQNQNREIMTEGDGAYISDGGIQVTPDGIGSDRSLKAGRATYFQPLHLWDRESRELASFTTNFTFVIDSNRATFYADGLT